MARTKVRKRDPNRGGKQGPLGNQAQDQPEPSEFPAAPQDPPARTGPPARTDPPAKTGHQVAKSRFNFTRTTANLYRRNLDAVEDLQKFYRDNTGKRASISDVIRGVIMFVDQLPSDQKLKALMSDE